jgi:hypothetical protein
MIVVHRQPNLLEVVAATHSSSGLSSGLDRREKQSNEHTNDRNHNKEFNKREPLSIASRSI